MLFNETDFNSKIYSFDHSGDYSFYPVEVTEIISLLVPSAVCLGEQTAYIDSPQ